MPTTAKSRQTREQIMDQGLRLFNAQGYHGTGIKEVLDAAGIPKGSFYHYFDSKEHFALEIIEHYRNLECNRLPPRESSSGDRLQQLRGLLETVIDEYEQPGHTKIGCLIVNLSAELANSSEGFRQALEASNARVVDELRLDFELAQQQQSVRSDLPAEQLATLFWSAWQGAMLRMKLTRDTTPLRQVVTLLFDQLFKPAG